MPQRPIRRILLAGLATSLTLAFIAPAFAAEGDAPSGGISYFSQFLHTDNPLGTALIWMCLFTSIAVVSLIIQNAMNNRISAYLPPDLLEALERLFGERNFREAIEVTASDNSPLGQVMRAALSESPHGYHAMEMALEDMAESIGNRKVRNLIWLEIAGAAGPMVGLFGTVFGMILAFQQLVAAGGSPKASQLAGGIATALVCTFWGLVVGIPGVITASLFRVRIEGLTSELIVRSKLLIAGFRPGAAKKAGTPTAAAPRATATPA